jgi:hypothetical protein
MNTILDYYSPVRRYFIKRSSDAIQPYLPGFEPPAGAGETLAGAAEAAAKGGIKPGLSLFSPWNLFLYPFIWSDLKNFLAQSVRFIGGHIWPTVATSYYANPEFFGPVSRTIHPIVDRSLGVQNANTILSRLYR